MAHLSGSLSASLMESNPSSPSLVDESKVLSGSLHVLRLACAGWMPRPLMDPTKPSATVSITGRIRVSLTPVLDKGSRECQSLLGWWGLGEPAGACCCPSPDCAVG